MVGKRLKKATKRPQFPEFRSPCPVASALDLFGDKWTLVVLRTIFAGASRYSELSGMSEHIATNILADRLDKLERYGLIARTPYRNNPVRYRYRLTPKGADILPVLQAMAAWSARHIPDRWQSPAWFTNGRPEDFMQEHAPTARRQAPRGGDID